MAVHIETYDDGLPISVVVPLSPGRKRFFEDYVLPLIRQNRPKEIIINDDAGGAPKKRNDGFKKATQPFVFFCDDDIVLTEYLLQKLYDALIAADNPHVAYAYCGYRGVVLHPKTHPMGGDFDMPSRAFSADILRKRNYISTMSLIRSDRFPLFDESLKRLQDWDVWLTLLGKGDIGVFVPKVKFFAYYLDEGITSNTNNGESALSILANKHGLSPQALTSKKFIP